VYHLELLLARAHTQRALDQPELAATSFRRARTLSAQLRAPWIHRLSKLAA
jgi:hypothetical protein